MGIQACSQNFQKGGDKTGWPSTTLRGRLSWEVTKETVVQPVIKSKLKRKL